MAELAAAALLLDLDGTLWNSAAWYPKLMAEACGQGGPEIETALQHKAVARVLSDFGITQARFAELSGDLGSSLVVFDGVADVLARVAARGIPTGAVTNLPGWIATPMLRASGLAPLLNVVVPYSRTVRPKPGPGGLQDALNKLNVAASSASWYVGDTAADAAAAKAAGMSFAWAGYAASCPPPADTHRVLSAFSEVEDLFPCA